MAMKFDYIVGNPPYQEESAGDKIMDKPVYHNFMSAAYACADKVLLITPGRFLFGAGATPADWNTRMLSDPHLKVEFYEPVSGAVFSGTDIKGGVAITYRDSEREFGAIETFTPFECLNSIRKKVVASDDFSSLSSIIFIQNNFVLDMLLSEHPEYAKFIGSDGRERRVTSSIFRMIDAFHDVRENDDVSIYGIISNKRVTKFINKRYIDDNGNFFKYKVILPKNNGSGAIGEVVSTPVIGEPVIGYTQSFLGIGAFDTRDEANACLKYIKSKFSRVMLGILKVTQNGSKSCYRYVPLQNFDSKTSDIDWSKSIKEIDQQLYKKYNLSQEEIAFIETHVKEMS